MYKLLFIAPINSVMKSYQGIERIKAYLDQNRDIKTTIMYIPMEEILSEKSLQIYTSFDIVGMSVHAMIINTAFEVFQKIKQINNKIFTVLGSMFATHCADLILQECCYVDFIVLGNGEKPLKDAIDRLSKTNKLCSLNDHENIVVQGGTNENKIAYKANLRELPWPNRLNPYETDFMHIVSKEGCVGKCSFCSAHSTGYNEETQRDPQDVVNEMMHIYTTRNVDNFFITDGIFEGVGQKGKDRIFDFCACLKKAPIKFSISCYMRPQSIKESDIPMLKLMRSVGFHSIIIGVESADENDLKIYRKANTKSDSLQAISCIRESDIMAKFGFIMINPYSTMNSLLKNLDFLNSVHSYYPYHYLTKIQIYYNSPLYHRLKSDELLTPQYTYKSMHEYYFVDQKIAQIDSVISRLLEGGLGELDRRISEVSEFINGYKIKYYQHDYISEQQDGVNVLYRKIADENVVLFRNIFNSPDEKICEVEFQKYNRNVSIYLNELGKYMRRFMKYDLKQKL